MENCSKIFGFQVVPIILKAAFLPVLLCWGYISAASLNVRSSSGRKFQVVFIYHPFLPFLNDNNFSVVKRRKMRIIKNPFSQDAGYHCIGCDPHHPAGLKLRFFETDDGLVCRWKPDHGFQGYPDILHGGIQATILDEIASWFVLVKLETSGVTSKMEVEYLKPVRISQGDITVKARLREHAGKNALIETELLNGAGERCARGLLTYFVYPVEIAVKRMNYPGIEAFRGEEINDFDQAL